MNDDICRFSEIMQEIKDLVNEAVAITKAHDDMTYQRAKGYWAAHIAMAVDKDHGYLGSSMFTMEDALNDLESLDEEFEDDCPFDNDDLPEEPEKDCQ